MKNCVTAAVAAASLLSWCAWIAPAVLAGDEVPDSLVNPVTGGIEVADSYPVAGSHEIRHVVNPGQGPLRVTVLTSNPADDLGPKIVASSAGRVWVTWWRAGATNQVLVRPYDPVTGAWLPEFAISAAGESSSRPVAASDGSRPFVAYVVDNAGGRWVAMAEGQEIPQPWPSRSMLGPAAPAGDIELTLTFESGHLWVSWLRGSSVLSWTEYDRPSRTWSVPLDEPVTGGDTQAARGRIRARVIGP